MPKRPDYISQSKLADILGVTRQAVQKLCKKGGKFEPAMNEKRKINRWHDIIVQHKADLDAKKVNGKDPITQPGEKTPSVIPSQVKNSFNMQIDWEDVKDLTLEQIVKNYGGIQGFKNYMDALVKMSDWKAKEDKRLRERNKLIEKEPTAKSLFSIVNMMLSRMVNEYPTSVIDQIFAIAKGKKKTARIDAINLMKEALSKIIKDAKKELIRDLEKLED
jgi:predicted transcriptional regulator